MLKLRNRGLSLAQALYDQAADLTEKKAWGDGESTRCAPTWNCRTKSNGMIVAETDRENFPFGLSRLHESGSAGRLLSWRILLSFFDTPQPEVADEHRSGRLAERQEWKALRIAN